ncbi:hypothetical protein IW148_004765 [Coemansia sp. RSA 1199]|nr:hypothetical protein IW148_004765 [Coemansia sp. RSA 1199]
MNIGRLVALQRRRLTAASGARMAVVSGSHTRLKLRMRNCMIHTSAVTKMPDHNDDGSQHQDGSEPKEAHVSSDSKSKGTDEAIDSLESIFDMVDSLDKAKSDNIPSLKSQISKPNPSNPEDQTDSSQTLNFDDLFSAISQNRNINQTTQSTTPKIPRFEPTSEPKDYDNGETSIDDMFLDMDEEYAKSSSSKSHISKGYGGSDDPMQEFERILADMAGSDTKAYKAIKPAPLFWNEDEIKKSEGSRNGFLDDLSPQSLFEGGYKASAFSAGRLVGDTTQISSLALRIQRISEDTRHKESRSDAKHRRKQDLTKASKMDQDLERNLLSALGFCRSVPQLSKFVFMTLLSPRSNAIKGLPDARPSPVVYAEVVRISRELKAPSIGMFLYNHCRTGMRLADRLRVLNYEMYSELLTTAWRCNSDISAVLLIMQDVIAMGVIGRRDMERQIDQIIVELRKVYKMPNIADLVLSLKDKITFNTNSTYSVNKTAF